MVSRVTVGPFRDTRNLCDQRLEERSESRPKLSRPDCLRLPPPPGAAMGRPGAWPATSPTISLGEKISTSPLCHRPIFLGPPLASSASTSPAKVELAPVAPTQGA
eukprot:3362306-Pyramimonas_sp.AAC.1